MRAFQGKVSVQHSIKNSSGIACNPQIKTLTKNIDTKACDAELEKGTKRQNKMARIPQESSKTYLGLTKKKNV